MSKPLVNVLVQFLGSPIELDRQLSAISRQTYDNIHIIIGYNHKELKPLIEATLEDSTIPYTIVRVGRKTSVRGKIQYAPAYLELNRLIDFVQEGFIATIPNICTLDNRYSISRMMEDLTTQGTAATYHTSSKNSQTLSGVCYHKKDQKAIHFDGQPKSVFRFCEGLKSNGIEIIARDKRIISINP